MKIYKYLPPIKSNSTVLYFTSIESKRAFTCKEIKMALYYYTAKFRKEMSGYLFTCGLFNNAISSSHDRMTEE
jgi:hypothetical protein